MMASGTTAIAGPGAGDSCHSTNPVPSVSTVSATKSSGLGKLKRGEGLRMMPRMPK